jgi:hypothetical protein
MDRRIQYALRIIYMEGEALVAKLVWRKKVLQARSVKFHKASKDTHTHVQHPLIFLHAPVMSPSESFIFGFRWFASGTPLVPSTIKMPSDNRSHKAWVRKHQPSYWSVWFGKDKKKDEDKDKDKNKNNKCMDFPSDRSRELYRGDNDFQNGRNLRFIYRVEQTTIDMSIC